MKNFIVSFVVVLLLVGLVPSLASAGFKYYGTSVDPVNKTEEHTPPSWRELLSQEVDRGVERIAEIARLKERVRQLEVDQERMRKIVYQAGMSVDELEDWVFRAQDAEECLEGYEKLALEMRGALYHLGYRTSEMDFHSIVYGLMRHVERQHDGLFGNW